MKYYKRIEDDYISAIGVNIGGTEITETEYNEILSVIQNKPQDTDAIGYRLKTDLTWESYEKEPEPDPEPTDDDYATAGRILMGVEV